MVLPFDELLRGAERAYNVYRILNVREGFSRKDDRFPERWIDEPLKKEEGRLWLMDYFKTTSIDRAMIEKIFDEYYQEKGWDVKKGIPTREKLESLGLREMAEDLGEKFMEEE